MDVSAGLAALGLLSFAIASAGLAAHDVRHGTIPNRGVVAALAITAGLTGAAIIAHGAATGEWTGPEPAATGGAAAAWPSPAPALPWLAETFGAALACFAGALALWLAAPGHLGGGDVKAAPLAGLALGFATGWPGVLWGMLLAAAIAAVIAALRGIARRRVRAPRGAGAGPAARALPFAPALFGGAWLVLVVDAGMLLARVSP
ncbi:hypothetical protein JD292_02415 [Leucobacter sp. CSA2]|uniref:Prepilin type IV endopeptidase peptidase domain-containing protein n=1 Tax=Leucobacter edaphi TaxID=2796472 RepID=A0A934UWG3_9MICO|nr:hypothetical protein [Leucobacter edaphi]MBK0420935.1 hypothetical protein [Leucobacter edaphi]